MIDIENSPLSADQCRVLACLMEKHLTTPANYPLTPNSLTLACNQKTNRFPVMQLEEGKVVNTAQQLSDLGLVSVEYGERVNKYSHRTPGVFGINREEQAVLSILMLREPLTLADIKARTEKSVGFDSLEDIGELIDGLITRTSALIMQLPLAVGQREERFTHLLCGEPDVSEFDFKATKSAASTSRGTEQSTKLDELEQRIKRIEAALDMSWPE